MASTANDNGVATEADGNGKSDNNSPSKIKTAILMLNMGGPESEHVDDVKKFLLALFDDKDIIKMPMQS